MKKKFQRKLSEVLREEMYLQDRIAGVLKEGPKTIPEMSLSLGFPSSEVTMWIMAMRRYGKITDLPKNRADDYYHYKLVEGK